MLSFAEFCTAIFLVENKIKGIEVPDHLPEQVVKEIFSKIPKTQPSTHAEAHTATLSPSHTITTSTRTNLVSAPTQVPVNPSTTQESPYVISAQNKEKFKQIFKQRDIQNSGLLAC